MNGEEQEGFGMFDTTMHKGEELVDTNIIYNQLLEKI